MISKSVLAAIVLAALLTGAPARAQTYAPGSPVCLHVFGELEGERIDCIFASFDLCRAAASGRPAMCVVNPAAPATKPGRRIRESRKQPHAQ
jgi:hypothetical protein